jgi:hypothetical protein
MVSPVGKICRNPFLELLLHSLPGLPYQLCAAGELDKHAHLQFYTADKRHVLSFVDYRRFGRWEEGADWGRDRGPDPVYEHDAFRLNVLNSLQVWARIQ